jgi:hypothetical protein
MMSGVLDDLKPWEINKPRRPSKERKWKPHARDHSTLRPQKLDTWF